MIKEIDISSDKKASEIFALQLSSYRVEADIIGYDDLPPLKDTVQTLQESGETFYGYDVNGELLGVISLKVEKGLIDIYRLFVDPLHFRKGIAHKLLNFIENLNESKDKLIVSTATKNMPAIAFYLKNGFIKVKETKVSEELSLSLFEKKTIVKSAKKKKLE